MRKPNNYDATKASTGEYERLVPGGYIIRITNVKEEVGTSNAGRPYWRLAIAYDIAEGDLAGYFKRQHEQWGGNWKGVYRQNIEDNKGSTSPFFKGMIESFERSNPGFLFDFNNEKCLIGKLVGATFGEEEYMYNGEKKTSVKLRGIRSVEAIREGRYKVPELKKLKQDAAPADAFAGYTDITMEDCPF